MKPEEDLGFIISSRKNNLSMKALIELLKTVTEKGRSFRIQALGFSMYPFIKDRDYITISPLSSDYPRVGDVVAFIRPETEKLVVHRVVENKKTHYLIKGDNTLVPDGMIPKTNILGYVTKIDRNGKLVRFGSGLERIFIALLSRKNLLRPTIHFTSKITCLVIRRIKF